MAGKNKLRELYLSAFLFAASFGAQEFASAQEAAAKAGANSTLPNLHDLNMVLSAAGVPSAQNLDWGKIIGITLFSGIGFIAFVYGKKNALYRALIIGIALMAYPFFVSSVIAIYLIGIALIAALYFWRD